MKKWWMILIVVGAISVAIYDFAINKHSDKQEARQGEHNITSNEANNELVTGLEAGNEAPDFELKTMNGETVKLSDYRGEKVLLNFWATWCPPCREEIPDMQKYHEEVDDGVILAVNLFESEQSMEQIENFLDEYGVTFQVLMDEDTDVSGMYKAYALPTSYFINSDGTVHVKAIGAINYDILVEQFKEMN